MNATEKTDILLEKLKADSVEYKGLVTQGFSLEEKCNPFPYEYPYARGAS